jgi:hypothetical protein
MSSTRIEIMGVEWNHRAAELGEGFYILQSGVVVGQGSIDRIPKNGEG